MSDEKISRNRLDDYWYAATAVPTTSMGGESEAADKFICYLLMAGEQTITPGQLVRMLGFYRAAFQSMIRDVGKHYGVKHEPRNASTEDLALLMMTEALWNMLRDQILQGMQELEILEDEDLWKEYVDIRDTFEVLQDRFENLASRLRS